MEQRKPCMQVSDAPFDFDSWRKLAETDPESFEDCRRRLIHDVIESSPGPLRRRLRGLQWRIDMEIRRSKNAMDGCLRINRMLLDSVYAKDGLVESIRNLTDGQGIRQGRSVVCAKVIPMHGGS